MIAGQIVFVVDDGGQLEVGVLQGGRPFVDHVILGQRNTSVELMAALMGSLLRLRILLNILTIIRQTLI